MRAMTLEIERKYINVDFDALRPALKGHGARCAGAHFERNVLFDTAGELLLLDKRLLRLRTQEWPDKKRYLLTLKSPRESQNGFKVCDEREAEVADGVSVSAILEGLGYAMTARYEKIRECWRLNAVEVCLDVLPFVTAVELEGDPARLSRVAALLGLDERTASIKNYHDLHQDWRRRHNMPFERSFVFSGEQRRFWRKKLGFAREI
ncbi:MAG: class IV adenylate cyclase [Desulfovibrio sp.]|jgi:adenylate cyclase class 2|nr:class IV adenylate cyclase [Desulfovibrio sp.]